jgi:chorismate mutase
MAKDPHAEAEKLYQQILDALEEMTHVYMDAGAAETEDDEGGIEDDDIVDMMIEEAAERGLDEESVNRVFKAVAMLAKKAQEG